MSISLYLCHSIKIDRKSVQRYMGYRGMDDTRLLELIDTFSAQAEHEAAYRICYTSVPLQTEGNIIHFGEFPPVISQKLAENLRGANSALLFCATCGVYFDRKISASKLQPSQALVWDAVGTAAIEQLCDDFCASMGTVRPRFSPGYGDLTLSFQKDLMQWLNTEKNLGVCLTDSLLMTPTKSVSAIAAQE